MDSKVWQRAAADLNPPGVPNSFRHAKTQQNIASVLLRREFGGSRRQKTVRAIGEDKEENFWAESESAAKHQSRYFELPQTTKSTISIAISPDGKTFASTHGDHTVKIICIETGKVIQTLVGHPRTPWSVKFHPTDPRYVASGCLGFQVRFWDIETGRCLYVSTLRHAIISISFHPSGDILAIASGTCVYTWDYQHTSPRIAMFSYQTLRSVTFLPDPSKIMVGEANERYVRPQGQAPPSDLTVTLTMWDFDPSWALSPEPLLTKKAMNNSRVILSHALIYNDGGFDISRCGRYLAICADFSLRQAEKEVEMEAENEAATDLESILSSVPATQETTVGGATSPSDDVNDVSVSNPQATASNESSSSSGAAARTTRGNGFTPQALPATMPLSLPIHPPPPRLVPLSGMHTGAPNMLAALQSAAADLSLTMDQYMNQQIRRVRPRLHPPHSIHRYTAAMEPARSTAAPAAVPQQRYSQIRPNIALSRTRFTRNQRNRRGRLSSENQSTWLALISLDPEQLGRVVQTCHLAETAAGGVTSVKISPTSAYVLLGYGVRDRIQRETEFPVHRVTRIYRWEDMALLSHVESAMDDVNIALFSPICGGGFLYGTKQGKLRVCSTFRGDFHDEENCNVLDGPRRCHYDQNVNDDDDDDDDLGEEGDEDDDGEDDDEDGADDEDDMDDIDGEGSEDEDADMGE
ncbi:hypothetical protein PC129_g6005 [Phytophthora cactorum]|uniref:Uncharacterized protein n=2 Tax=Phytophthora cactorum TaxID=29920 RepID=A0A329SUV3_9STRA|nr:hypothetical protein Pcac1_g23402 [Phytophthora cactorum]KAG2829648.1 hypothetical protein PC112_g8025 [Phytophthora cactorum]KAG2831626.1 hypothetical protein PC111_g6937 [Phytophthora cactorum]KAG2860174.1 hypothetical protein PC113_g8297 [Phytophthora cactorum]KAG2928556.1 hypothetical protein PC115_g7164 [Phytophthora cactorum]